MIPRIDVLRFVAGPMLAFGALLVAGCATPVHEARLDPGLFLRSPSSADTTVNAPIALVADAALAQFRYGHESRGLPTLVIPVGTIVEAATVAALSDEFGRSVMSYPSVDAATEANRPVALFAMIVPRPVRFEIHEESFPLWIPFFPVVVPITTREDLRLIVDWQVLDSEGKPLWTKRYDSGDVKLIFGRPGDRDLKPEDFFVRLAHEVAYTLMREAARDVRHWIEAERLRERVL